MKDKKMILTSLSALLILLAVGGVLLFNKPEDKEKGSNNNITDAIKFKEEYTKIEDDHVFVYRSIEEIIKILENGTGVVYLGFPECPWCQAYVPYLNEVAKNNNISKIYYYNILNDRKENTENYQKILELLGDYAEHDDEGNKRIYAPTIIFVNDGKIEGMDSETAKDTKGFEKPEDYWNEEAVKALKERLAKLCDKVDETTCSDCNK